jgi:hypothetical protein
MDPMNVRPRSRGKVDLYKADVHFKTWWLAYALKMPRNNPLPHMGSGRIREQEGGFTGEKDIVGSSC